MDTLGPKIAGESDASTVLRLVHETIQRGALDAWTVTSLASRLGLPSLPIQRALDELTSRGLVMQEDGEYLAPDNM